MMPDKGSEDKLQQVYLPLAEAWVQVRQEMFSLNKLQIKVTAGMRTFNDQSHLYSFGRSRSSNGLWTVTSPKKVVTHARAGESLHQYGLAIDSCFICDDPYLAGPEYKSISDFMWKEYGRLCKKNGLIWGGDWVGAKIDRPHCEASIGLTIHDLQMIHEEGGIDQIWNKCNQQMLCGRKIV